MIHDTWRRHGCMTHDTWNLSCLSVVILGARDAVINKFPSSLEEFRNPTGARQELGKEASPPHPKGQ